MMRRPRRGRHVVPAIIAVLMLLPLGVRAAEPALDMDARLTVNMPGPNGTLTTFFTSTHGLPGSVDTGPVGTGPGAACPDAIGPGYVCAHGFASAGYSHYLAGTMPQPLPIAVVSLGAQSTLHVHDAPAATAYTMDSDARTYLPFGCYGPSPALTVQINLNIRFDGTESVSSPVPGFTTFVAQFLNQPVTCTTGGGLCHLASGQMQCDGTRKTMQLELRPLINLRSDSLLSGWNGDIDLDTAHTMTIESIDVLDDQNQPIAGARAWIADPAGDPAAYFLRADEVGVVGPVGATPTPTAGPGSTPTASPTPTAIATPAVCATFAKPKLTLGKIAPPAGDDTLVFGGGLPLASGARDPDVGGLTIRLADSGGPVVEVTLPPGSFEKATKTGWKVNRKRTKWTWVHPKTGAPAGILKAVIATKKDGVVATVKAAAGDFASSPPAAFTLAFPLNGDCATTTFDAPPSGCIVKSKGKTLVCK